MIRIDEIYNNIFLPKAQQKNQVGIKWFDPFGSTDFENLVSLPEGIHAKHYLFYDQEVIYQERFAPFAEQYLSCYKGRNILVHSEYNSETVDWACNTYGFEQQYYFFHGWAALDWYRGYNRAFLHQPRNLQHLFLCPNNIVGGKRQHRLDLFNELCKRDLVKNNLVSMPKICPYENINVKDHIDYDIKLPLQIDNFNNYAGNSHQITMWEQAAKSFVHVVTETCYSGRKNHLTEKIFKPMILKQPFIVVGNKSSLEYLKRYGFETFSSVFNESYDTESDDHRIKAVGWLLDELQYADLDYLAEQCAPIVEHNYNWFYSGGFEKVLWYELVEMLNQW
jgi:hypothetical protein